MFVARMSYVFKKVFMLIAILTVSGCSYFETGEPVQVRVRPVQRVDLMNGIVYGAYSSPDQIPLSKIADFYSDGRVKIFPLDGDLYQDMYNVNTPEGSYDPSEEYDNFEYGVAVSRISAVGLNQRPGLKGNSIVAGLPYRLDPSVTIYSLGNGFAASSRPVQRSSIYEPTKRSSEYDDRDYGSKLPPMNPSLMPPSDARPDYVSPF